jgi:hypothetical protein
VSSIDRRGFMPNVHYVDTLIYELAYGRPNDKILRR